MKKLIRILSVIALAVIVMQLFTGIAVVLLQKPLCSLVGNQDRGVFAVPYAHIVGWHHVLLLAVLVFIFAGNRKVGIWLEIVILGESALLYPAFSYILSVAINSLQSRLGADMIITQSGVNALCTWVNMLFGIGSALLPVICGMSIAYKIMRKKTEEYELMM